MKRKTLGEFEVDVDQGVIHAVFSTLGVKDHDGDITIPGAFEQNADVRISAYNHASWPGMGGLLPVGKGRITSDDVKATLEGQFFMKTTNGRDTFETVKELGSLTEWSYGYDVLDSAPGEYKGVEGNLLKELKVHEVSPVFLGAGIGTHTVSAKNLTLLSDDELAKEAELAFKALHDRGIKTPESIVEAVIAQRAIEVEAKRRHSEVRVIAALVGIDHEGATA